MKLLFDENLSSRLATLLAVEFPFSVHIETLGMRGATGEFESLGNHRCVGKVFGWSDEGGLSVESLWMWCSIFLCLVHEVFAWMPVFIDMA